MKKVKKNDKNDKRIDFQKEKVNEFLKNEFQRALNQISKMPESFPVNATRIQSDYKCLCIHTPIYQMMFTVPPSVVNDVFLKRVIKYTGEETQNKPFLFCKFGKCDICGKYYYWVNYEFEELIRQYLFGE